MTESSFAAEASAGPFAGACSAAARRSYLQQAAAGELDVLIIGGGITGAGVLREASLRQARALVVEQGDFASGTSSRSSKLIHGGLRYLAQGQVALVREVSRERDVLQRIAPHLVHRQPVLIPLYTDIGMRPLTARMGLTLFDRLAGVDSEHRHQSLKRAQVLEKVRSLRTERLVGGLQYDEFSTNDARMVVETLKAACQRGCAAMNYARVDALTYADGRVTGAVVTDVLTGERYPLRARAVVNAAGPWVDHVRSLDTAQRDAAMNAKRLHLTKGIHLVFSQARFPLDLTVMFPGVDERTLFAIPHGDCTYVGTTDTDYDGDPGAPTVTPADVRYLLDCIHQVFPDVDVSAADIIGCWAGVRPLLHEPGKSPSQISRRDEIIVSPSGLISVAGGKLTGFRKMAERAWAAAAEHAGMQPAWARPLKASLTEPLGGGGEIGQDALEACVDRGVPASVAKRWVSTFGSAWPSLCDLYASDKAMQTCLDAPRQLVAAEIAYLVRHEMAVRLEDVLVRRTDYYHFSAGHGRSVAHPIAKVMAELLGWDANRMAAEVEDYETYVRTCQGPAVYGST
ncbi:glycerol-3-phosphate dehydrogenase/oxidase [Alicyclobacillus cycloheptanicus]|uniref:Aerobic glycerol-3-phosphate dehydrogenase n=1 Tax=Alicyclobacillus cycloheptanicus TaxID=1457 RepID=A0ABT9XGD1_9BACL|nr:glycerol-3-phosphate dehydrogenase/oxidase [Alicyclobacillus cycloheptanicus]MDQ0189352.1 glycerol-3-phosphate dehydrogenase [Alicyclobacillus cycloheptanicus]WDM01294.1 glycerol-3-phosphate dehydrogenase/oxidase [Alicyclobacillus cycloheptanicus]